MPKPPTSRDARRGRAHHVGWLIGFHPWQTRPDHIDAQILEYDAEYDALPEAEQEKTDRVIERGRLAGVRDREAGRTA